MRITQSVRDTHRIIQQYTFTNIGVHQSGNFTRTHYADRIGQLFLQMGNPHLVISNYQQTSIPGLNEATSRFNHETDVLSNVLPTMNIWRLEILYLHWGHWASDLWMIRAAHTKHNM